VNKNEWIGHYVKRYAVEAHVSLGVADTELRIIYDEMYAFLATDDGGMGLGRAGASELLADRNLSMDLIRYVRDVYGTAKDMVDAFNDGGDAPQAYNLDSTGWAFILPYVERYHGRKADDSVMSESAGKYRITEKNVGPARWRTLGWLGLQDKCIYHGKVSPKPRDTIISVQFKVGGNYYRLRLMHHGQVLMMYAYRDLLWQAVTGYRPSDEEVFAILHPGEAANSEIMAEALVQRYLNR
jgi:hypothetical protein